MSMKILKSILLFFHDNNYFVSEAEFNDMQVDDIMSMYELLLEKNLYKKRELDRSMI